MVGVHCVLPHVVLMSEPLVTEPAAEGFLPRVDPHMILHVLPCLADLATDVTREPR